MTTYEKLNNLAKESHNDNFQLDRLDWTTRVVISDLCKIIDQQGEKINSLIEVLIKADTELDGYDNRHCHDTFDGCDKRSLKDLLEDD